MSSSRLTTRCCSPTSCARDRAPLHFGDVPLIHESISVEASTGSTIPFGVRRGNNTRDSVTPGFKLSASPTFDVSNLDAKDFVTGLANPIDPKFVKYWLDKGISSELALMLFFSSIEVNFVDPGENPKDKDLQTLRIKVANAPRPTIVDERMGGEICSKTPVCEPSQLLLYLHIANSLYGFEATVNSKSDPILSVKAEELERNSNLLRGIASLDAGKLKLKPPPDDSKSDAMPMSPANALVGSTAGGEKPDLTYKIIPSTPDQSVVFCYGFSKPDVSAAKARNLADAACKSQEAPAAGANNLLDTRQSVLRRLKKTLNDISLNDGFVGESQSGEERFYHLADTMLHRQNRRAKHFDTDLFVASPKCDYNYMFNREFLSEDEFGNKRSVPMTYGNGLASACGPEFKKLLKLDRTPETPERKLDNELAKIWHVDVWAIQFDPVDVFPRPKLNEAIGKDGCDPTTRLGVWLCGRMDREDWQAVFDYFRDLEARRIDCKTPEPKAMDANAMDTKKMCKPIIALKFPTRSVGEMIQYLGDALWYEDNIKRLERRNSPLTLSFCSEGFYSASHNCNSGALFRASDPGPDARFMLSYGGKLYGIAPTSDHDHSLQVLAIVNQLLDLNKSATDLKTTPTVQVVP